MKKNLSPFERTMKERLEGHEMPYEHSSWVALQRQMGLAKSGSSVWIVSLVSTVMLLSGAAIALYRHQHAPTVAQKASIDLRFPSQVTATTKGVSHLRSNRLEQPKPLDTSSATADANNTAVSEFSLSTIGENTAQASGNENPVVVTSISESSSPKFAVKADNIIEFSCNVRKACRGEEVEFQTSNGPKTGSYLWNFGDGHFSDKINPKHKFSKAGDYDVSLSITSDNGQINTTVVNDMITIEDAPDADFTWEFININPSSPEVRIINLSEGGNSFEWSNGTESKSIQDGATFQLKSTGRQMIGLNVKNPAGCSDGSVKYISVNSDFDLGAPKQWSPAKGNFMPQGLKKNKVDFEMVIYTMSGEKVYETSNRAKGWDGKLSGGAQASSGENYTYKVIVTNDHTQEQKYFFGTFNVFP
jgi:PKD repeat protein